MPDHAHPDTVPFFITARVGIIPGLEYPVQEIFIDQTNPLAIHLFGKCPLTIRVKVIYNPQQFIALIYRDGIWHCLINRGK